jgi:hypothetical protein
MHKDLLDFAAAVWAAYSEFVGDYLSLVTDQTSSPPRPGRLPRKP